MDANYLVLCGMVWAQFGQETAGRELIRALASPDEIVRVLARTMLEQGGGCSKELIGQALAEDEISGSMASLCGFEQGQLSKFKSWNASGWRPAALALGAQGPHSRRFLFRLPPRLSVYCRSRNLRRSFSLGIGQESYLPKTR